MPNNYFRFRQFTLFQDRCAMKVGTDGTLLGAWAQGGPRMLDVGTGTGLIALMMAQRYAQGRVVAIDIDREACQQARENVASSPFADRVQVECCPLQLWEGEAFDAIVSNPPYFDRSLKAPDEHRAAARHTDTLSYGELCRHACRLLSREGRFSVVIPFDYLSRFLAAAQENRLFLSRKCSIKTTPRKQPRRYLLEFAKSEPRQLLQEEGILEGEPNVRSEWYAALTRDFYL